MLASEASDLELEIIDLLRRTVKDTVGDVAIADGWKVERLSSTELRIRTGEAWFQGLPFNIRGANDELVSGASLSLGIIPPGITVVDDPSGLGKILIFSPGATPTGTYRIVVSASEQIITDVDDPFLKNVNITEATAQKVRILFTLNIVSNSNQTETPIPYTNDTGAYNTANLVNRIQITPTSGGNGELLLTTPISGSQAVDGRDLELTIRNDSGLGGGNPIPNGNTDQQAFYNGTLIDSNGNNYHINAVFNDTVPTQVIIRLDKEVNQPNPVITNTVPYYIIKRDVFVTDDVNGNPLGKLYWPIATANWNTTDGFVHDSKVVDLRARVIDEQEFENATNAKFDLVTVGGGTIALDIDGQTLSWDAAFSLINPSGPLQTINSGSAVLIDGGTLSYFLNLASGGVISVGNLAVTVSSAGATVSFSGGPDLSQVKVGNIIKVGSDIAQITAIDNVNKTVNVTPSISTTGAGTIYRDSYAPSTVPSSEKVFTLAALKGGKVVIGNALQLEAGRSNAIYDERTLFPTGLVANTNIIIPVNSRSGVQQYYDAVKGDLEVYANELLKFQGADWISIDNKTIQFNYALSNDTEVHFRIDSNPSGSLGGPHALSGGSASLQSAYNSGNTITTVSGSPVTISGAATKQLQIIGDMGVTGVIDPSGIEFTAQASDPLASATNGIWVNSSNEFMFRKADNTAINFNQTAANAITNLVAGNGLTGGGAGPTTTLDVNVDGSTLEINSDILRVKDAGITNAKIASGIDAVKIGSGIVDNTEFSQLDGVSSNIQTQLNSKQPTGNYITALTGDISATGPNSAIATLASIPNKRYIDFSSGNDSNTGSITQPWKTLAHAYASVTPSLTNPFVFYISGGNNDTDVGTITGKPNVSLVSQEYYIQIAQPLTISGGSTNDSVTFYNISFQGAVDWQRTDTTTIILNCINTQFVNGLTFKQNNPAGNAEINAGTSNFINSVFLLPNTFNFFNTCLFQGASNTFEDYVGQNSEYSFYGGDNGSNIILNGGCLAQFAGMLSDNGSGATITANTTANGTPTIQTDSSSIPSSISGTATIQLTSFSQHVDYTPTTSSDWNTPPTTVLSGLDDLAVSGIAKAQAANTVLAGPSSGGNSLPTFRALTAADLPSTTATAGESFAANTSFLVRWAVNGDTAGRVYKADSSSAATTGKFYAFGIALSTTLVNAGGTITITDSKTHTLGSGDTPFLSSDIGKPVYLTTSGGFSVTPPSTSGAAVWRIGTVQETTKIWVDMKQLNVINA